VLSQTGGTPAGDYEVGLLIRNIAAGAEHHDVLVRHKSDKTRRGFFAVNNAAAVAAEVNYSVCRARFGSESLCKPLAWVDGVIDDRDPLGREQMQRVDQTRYEKVRNRILSCTSNRYSLRFYHCQYWAAEKLQP
jgi:hypothetical protein